MLYSRPYSICITFALHLRVCDLDKLGAEESVCRREGAAREDTVLQEEVHRLGRLVGLRRGGGKKRVEVHRLGRLLGLRRGGKSKRVEVHRLGRFVGLRRGGERKRIGERRHEGCRRGVFEARREVWQWLRVARVRDMASACVRGVVEVCTRGRGGALVEGRKETATGERRREPKRRRAVGSCVGRARVCASECE